MAKILVSGSVAYDRIMDYPGYFRDSLISDKLDDINRALCRAELNLKVKKDSSYYRSTRDKPPGISKCSINVSFGVDGLVESFGGTAGNIAYNLALLGEEPEILSTAGNDFEEYRKWLIKSRVETRSISIAKELRTAGAFVVTDKGENQITIFHPGAMAREWRGKIPNIKHSHILKNVRVFRNAGAELAIVSAGNITDMVKLPKEFRSRGTPYFFDAGQAISVLSGDNLRDAIPGASALFGNEYEMELTMKKSGWNMKKLLEVVPVVVTTRGADGSRITTHDGEINIKAVLTDAIDPTGAGDAYRAGFAKGFLMKLPLEKTGRLASTVASFGIEKHGTQNHFFTFDELRKRYEDSYGEKLGG